jgi:hypothetical protein
MKNRILAIVAVGFVYFLAVGLTALLVKGVVTLSDQSATKVWSSALDARADSPAAAALEFGNQRAAELN